MGYRLLLVDGDDAHRDALGERLYDDGFSVTGVGSVRAALDAASREWPHLALVDVSFVDGTAETLARQLLRRGEVPFVVVSALVDSCAKVRALETFAEDYLGRPYLYAELLARVHRVLRRTVLRGSDAGDRVDLGAGDKLDPLRREIHRPDAVVSLTPTEARLLEFFVLNADRVLPTNLILQRVWSEVPAGDNTLWEYVRRLRRKLGDGPGKPARITSVRGLGYRYWRIAASAPPAAET
jgi:DNA-binding response OmpR family regulator